jgi:ribose/xylose/arabinose/galactoside ABC-type transport system permease subunit
MRLDRRSGGALVLPAETGVAAVLCVACVWLAVAFPSFRSGASAWVVIGNASEVAILAAGMTLVIATGGIDVSVGSVLGFCAMVLGKLAGDAGWGLGAACAAALGTGLACGTVNGLLIARCKVPPIVATLAMFAAGRAGAYVLSGGASVSRLPDALIALGYGSLGGLPLTAWIAGAVLGACGVLMRSTAYGRGLLALGGGREAAYLSGRPTATIETAAYALNGLLAGLAAILVVARGATAIPDAGRFLEMTAITAVVMGGTPVTGGKATMVGTMLGVLAIGVITNGVRAYGKGDIWVLLVLGLALLASVEVDRWRTRERRYAA